jgi:PAS domain-containing protein
MPESSRVVELLKAKAMLLIQREREVYALRLGRERMMAWLHAFQDLSLNAQPETGIAMCETWTRAMLQELHFQTAAAFSLDRTSGELRLIHGESHTPISAQLSLGAAARRLLGEKREGVFDAAGDDPAASALSESLRLHRFMWFAFEHGVEQDILLVAGVAAGVSGAQAFAADDLINFVMLGRHLAVLLSNAALITELDSVSRRLQELFDHMRQAIVAFDHTGAVGRLASRQARLIFEQESLDGKSVRELLYPGAPEYDVAAAAFHEWMLLAFATPAENWATCESFAPSETLICTHNGQRRLLELEFRPIAQDGRVTQIMLLASDVSAARGPGYVLSGSWSGRLKAGIDRVRQALELSCELLTQASPLGSLIFDQITVRRSTLRELIELAGNRPDRLGALVAQLASVPFGLTAAGVLESAASWAAQQGNSVVLRVQQRELMVPEALAQVLPGVLAHLVRNAIAHGIESPEERVALGKPEAGNITVTAQETPAGICVVVADDGRGVNAERVLSRAGSAAAAGASVAELVFLPGLSTREGQDALAGRGVGLDAVRAELGSVGYDAILTFTHEVGTTVTLAPKQPVYTVGDGG